MNAATNRTERLAQAMRTASLTVRWPVSVSAMAVLLASLLSGCGEVLNNPHPPGSEASNTLYVPFTKHSPKTLDPTSSYSNDETPYTYQVYEPPYGYHYLKRPYELIGRSAQAVSQGQYLDRSGQTLPDDAPGDQIAQTVFEIKIKPGIQFAPHPAFAKNAQGAYLYHALTPADLEGKYQIPDFPKTGSRELLAEDFVYGIRRLASPRIKSPSFSTMASYIVGLKSYAEKIAQFDKQLREGMAPGNRDLPFLDFREHGFEGATAVDKYTLKIRLKGKYPQFKYWLAMTFFAPMPWEAEKFYAQPGMAQRNLSLNYWPVGTGPYMLTEFSENRRHVLQRNPLFRGETYPCEGEPQDQALGYLKDCGKTMPFIDKVVFDIEKEDVPLQAKFIQGFYDSPAIERLDVGTGYIVQMADDKAKEKEFKDKGVQLPTTVEANNFYLGFNWLDPVVGQGKTPEEAEAKRKLRQALSIAIDWEEHVAIFERGQGVAAHGPVPPSLFGYRADGPAAFNPVVYNRGADGQVLRRPIQEAQRLLAEAGYPGGRHAQTGQPLVLNFDYSSSAAGSKSMLDWYTKQFAKIGVQLEIRATDYNRFQEKMNKGTVQLFTWGWLADYPDAENFLFMLYSGNAKAMTQGNGENAANYSSPAFDRLFERMKFLEDGPEKQHLIDQMIEITQQDAVWSFGYFSKSAAAYHQWIGNGKATQLIRNNIAHLNLDVALRAQKISEWNKPVWWPLPLLLGLFLLLLLPAGLAWRRREQQTAARTLAPQDARA
jgi:ABC-type transport system substrate-binding protein